MATPISFSSIFLAGAGVVLGAVPTGVNSQSTPLEWTLTCHPGTDGFAANCIATQKVGDFTLKLQSADSQVFVSILHERCETSYRNFDRQDLILLDPAERRALVERAFHEIAEEVRRTCPTLAPPAPAPATMPDIAILSPDTDH